MTLDELMKVIKEDTWICVEVIHENAATEFWYPPKEIMYKEWMEYEVISIEGYRNNGGIVITVKEVEKC